MCDCTNNNEPLHKIGVLQRYVMLLFVLTRKLYKRFDGAVSIHVTVVLKESDNKFEGSSLIKTFFCVAFAKMQDFFVIYMFAGKSLF